jgi:hypothetical protein
MAGLLLPLFACLGAGELPELTMSQLDGKNNHFLSLHTEQSDHGAPDNFPGLQNTLQ